MQPNKTLNIMDDTSKSTVSTSKLEETVKADDD